MWQVLNAVTILFTICPDLQRKKSLLVMFTRRKIKFQLFSPYNLKNNFPIFFILLFIFLKEILFFNLSNKIYFSGSNKTTVHLCTVVHGRKTGGKCVKYRFIWGLFWKWKELIQLQKNNCCKTIKLGGNTILHIVYMYSCNSDLMRQLILADSEW